MVGVNLADVGDCAIGSSRAGLSLATRLTAVLTQGALAEAMGVQRKHVNELCNDRRAVTAPTALILARVFGNSADFWLNVQRRSDLWQAMHSPRERERIARARPLTAA
jgi:antitoxin HigA-1